MFSGEEIVTALEAKAGFEKVLTDYAAKPEA